MSGELVDVARYDYRVARVRVNRHGDWLLSVAGTDIYRKVWNDRDLQSPAFPGQSLGHRLIELGWMPDRCAMYGAFDRSDPQKLALTELGGWVPSDTEDGVWTIPVYREV